jgi:hypothetical protein
MANTNPESAVLFSMTDNQVEIIRTNAVRRLISSPNQTELVILDEHNHPWSYVIDVPPLTVEEEEDVAGYAPETQAQLKALAVTKRIEALAAFFVRVLAGEPTRVKTRQRVHAAAELLAE